MGKIEAILAQLAGQRVYVDTNLFIFFLDNDPVFCPALTLFFRDCLEQRILATTGAIAIAEVMVHPYRNNDTEQIANIKSFFNQKGFLHIVGHDIDLFDTAAQYAGQRGMKLIDALHYVTALQSGCSFLLTHDHKFKSCSTMEVIQLQEMIAN